MSQARQDGITLRQWLPLVGLTCCAFVFNTSEIMPSLVGSEMCIRDRLRRSRSPRPRRGS